MNDLYRVLGVSPKASGAQIKSAYRKLAKKLHPDLNPNNANVSERFKAVSAANSILGDAGLRRRYDLGEIDANGKEMAARRGAAASAGATAEKQGFSPFGQVFNRDDLFAELFGKPRRSRARPMATKGPDLSYQISIGFVDAATGVTKRLTLQDDKTFDVKIPRAVQTGQHIRLKGQGGPGLNGGKPGDALVEITVEPHKFMTRQGDDIHLDLPITLQEAVLGGKVKVPTIAGQVTMTIPKGSNTGRVLRLAGKGLAAAGGKCGDQFVTLKVVLPKKPDSDLQKLVSDWSAKHPYDVRSGFKRL